MTQKYLSYCLTCQNKLNTQSSTKRDVGGNNLSTFAEKPLFTTNTRNILVVSSETLSGGIK